MTVYPSCITPLMTYNLEPTPHDDVIKWKHFPCYRPFVRGIHRSLVNSPHKDQWRGTLMFSLICSQVNCWVNNREARDLRRHRAHYDVIVMICQVATNHSSRPDSTPSNKRHTGDLTSWRDLQDFLFLLVLHWTIVQNGINIVISIVELAWQNVLSWHIACVISILLMTWRRPYHDCGDRFYIRNPPQANFCPVTPFTNMF